MSELSESNCGKERFDNNNKNLLHFCGAFDGGREEKIWLVISLLLVVGWNNASRCVRVFGVGRRGWKYCRRFMSRLSSCHRKCSVRRRHWRQHHQQQITFYGHSVHTTRHKNTKRNFIVSSSFLHIIYSAPGEDLLAISTYNRKDFGRFFSFWKLRKSIWQMQIVFLDCNAADYYYFALWVASSTWRWSASVVQSSESRDFLLIFLIMC